MTGRREHHLLAFLRREIDSVVKEWRVQLCKVFHDQTCLAGFFLCTFFTGLNALVGFAFFATFLDVFVVLYLRFFKLLSLLQSFDSIGGAILGALTGIAFATSIEKSEQL